jgi:hypothetical protein
MKLLPDPGPQRRRQIWQLGALVAVLAILLWYHFRQTAPPGSTSNRMVQAPAAASGALRLPEPLKLSALAAAPGTADIGRNPFVYGTRPAAPLPAPSALPPSRPPLPAAAPAPQGPPPIPLTLAGIAEMPGSGRAMATLRDPISGALFQALEGDVVDGRYRVVRIGVQSVVLSYLDGSGSRTIPLGG